MFEQEGYDLMGQQNTELFRRLRRFSIWKSREEKELPKPTIDYYTDCQNFTQEPDGQSYLPDSDSDCNFFNIALALAKVG